MAIFLVRAFDYVDNGGGNLLWTTTAWSTRTPQTA